MGTSTVEKTQRASKKAAIIQSSYIPWKGYFDVINYVDDFVLFDDVQFTRRDWRNRNKLKTPNGTIWLTIPVEVKGKYLQPIKETAIASPEWANNHFQSWKHSYSKSPYWKENEKWLQDLYKQAGELKLLSHVNHLFIKAICDKLSIETKLHWSSDFQLAEGKTERLLSICQQLGSKEYLSGPAAKVYLTENTFTDAGLSVAWLDYRGYLEYEQVHPPFSHEVSILDMIFSLGPEAKGQLKSVRGLAITESAT